MNGRMSHRVVVTGVGAVTPLGPTVGSFWERLLGGESGVRLITQMPVDGLRVRIGAQAAGFEPSRYFSRKELQRLSRSSQLALVAADEALRSAELDAARDAATLKDTAVILGSSITSLASSEAFFYKQLETGIPDPLSIPVSMNLAPAANVALKYGCNGPLLVVDAACSSSSHAIGYVYNMIRAGVMTRAITGGAESPFSPGLLHAWSSMHALSEDNDTPQEACRPFSGDRNGMVLAEHAAILMVESLEAATERRAPILAEISGYGATSDSFHITQPSVNGPAHAMRRALEDAVLPAEGIDYINAHGTGTQLNDKAETEAIKRVFGPRAYRIPVVSIKGAVGHSLAASGALELVSCVLSIRDSVVPPTINLRRSDPDCDLDYVPRSRRTVPITHAMSNSFAFGGSNATLIVSRYRAESSPAA